MATNNKTNSAVSQALLDVDNMMSKIEESTQNTLRSLLDERVEKYIKEAIEKDDDYEVSDEDSNDADSSAESVADSPEAQEANVDEPAAEDAEGDNAEVEGEGEDAKDAEDSEENGDEWSEFDKYKVGEDTWDLTGEKDNDQVAKVYKLLKDDDRVVVKKDGDSIKLQDGETGAEYVIDLGSDDEPEAAADVDEKVNYDGNVNPDDPEVDEYDSDEQGDGSCDDGNCMNEGKNSKKVMKENKETLYEIDLGYTDNYQDKDPIKGLSMSEPSKSGKDWDEGLPKGTEKPWAGKSNDKGKPYGKSSVDEGCAEEGCCKEEAPIEEGSTTTSKAPKRHKTKTHSPNSGEEAKPEVSKSVSVGTEYKAQLEEMKAKLEKVLKENKALKKMIVNASQKLEESYVVNMNLGQITKLLSENSVTQSEKVDIINRFNEVKSVEASTALYESIKRELAGSATKMPVLNESSMTADGSRETIVESTNYKSQEELNIIDLMKRMNMM